MFLATTALSEFWDSSQELFFLGEWCQTDSSNKNIASFKSNVMPYSWDNAEKTEAAIRYCYAIYNEVLNTLTDKLNNIHGLKKEREYWELILGNWLMDFTHVVYDRYITLKSYLAIYEIDTIVLSETDYIIPLNHTEFIQKIVDDGYNLQLYSQVLKFLGYSFPSKHFQIKQNTVLKKSRSLKKILFQNILNLFAIHPKITVTAPYFSDDIKSYFKLLWASRGKIRFDDFEDKFYFNIAIDTNTRKAFRDVSNGNDEFTQLLLSLLETNLPLLFLEGFKEFRKFSLHRKSKTTLIYATSNAIHANYLYKFWLAENKTNIKTISIQHGGGYGVDKINPPETYERNVTDFFFTWGWVEDKKTVRSTHEKISQNIRPNKNGYILYSLTDGHRYVYRLHNSCYYSSAIKSIYIPKSISFLISVGHLDRFLLRGINGFGRNVTTKIKTEFSDILIDDLSKNFHCRLEEARICITDNVFTTYLETLAMNFPTIIFIDEHSHSFRRPDIVNLLIDAKILFYNEKEAAAHLNMVYDDIDRWWCSVKVQRARDAFCEHYANGSKNWAADWVNAFNKILEN